MIAGMIDSNDGIKNHFLKTCYQKWQPKMISVNDNIILNIFSDDSWDDTLYLFSVLYPDATIVAATTRSVKSRTEFILILH